MENQYPSTTYMPQPTSFAPYSSYSAHHPHQQQQHPQHPQHQQQQAQHQHQQHQQQQQAQSQQEPSRDTHNHNQTLPPLHTQAANFGQLPSLYNGSGSHPQTPTTVHTPTTSSMGANGLHAFSQQQQQHQSSPATTGSMLPPSSTYIPYSTSQSTLPPASTATSAAQTPAQARLPDLRPLQPQASYNNVSTLPSFGASGLVGAQPYMQNHESEPTHVVGSQGRRGILPSAPGRAAAPAPGTTAAASTKSMIPAKDADGKFPCPHCNKTYLHAKHLKRHLLRHTGDRPYMCHLCKDTFSRSDILKRHFQKCSIRRGNPTGANHLAHQRRNTNGSNRMSISSTEPVALAGLAEAAGAPYTNGTILSGVTNSPTVNGEGSSYASSAASISNRSSRANSLIHPVGMTSDGRGSLTGYPNGVPAYGGMRPHSASNPMPPSYGFQMGNGSQFYPPNVKTEEQAPSGYTHQPPPIAENRQPNGVDWSMFAPQHAHDGFMTQSHASQPQMPVKTEGGMDNHSYNSSNEHSNEQQFFGGLYSHPSGFGEDSGAHHLSGFPNWNMDLVQSDPLQAKANALLTYVLSNRTSSSDDACDEMRKCLTVENIKHFIEKFTSFQGHWPIIHMPTFEILKANDGLVLTIICIGAVYSEKRDLYQVRRMMELVKDAVKNASRVHNVIMGVIQEGNQPLGSLESDIEELQALYMLKVLFCWHGTPSQRANARKNFDSVVEIARRIVISPTGSGQAAYSVLHQPGPISQEALLTWTWSSWIAQERRNRVAFTLFLLDAALVMYFNNEPKFDPFEFRLPLPCDDAAWEARTEQECRDALGLNGTAKQAFNVCGSQRPRQPDMRSAMRGLMEPNYTFSSRSTNIYSKFILIHALLVQICKFQRASFLQNITGQFGHGATASGPGTPLGQNDWIASDGSSNVGTPSDNPQAQNAQIQPVLKSIQLAMSKWKTMWDIDIALQYPQNGIGYRRFGFSRDGIHFYYLGQSLLRSTKASEWTAPPDLRFLQIMGLLKKIKGFVSNENTQGGLDTGSVGDIDDTYGVGDLTLDMKLLFKPMGEADSPIAGVRTDTIR
ncbi:hypothetical protein D6C86_08224 [Aureobasidium pullulans]|uniref:C2H2-type domain-containing protein n=1 Tax=Aureobasidium pullulans TaxID=5580 RepID=A0A4S8ZQQ7_AURPU|nr:hypothetical protein D6D25_01357 [Aureobasidium pullulans]THY70468.1 hypothetical protein D6C94_08569 [Aureobasidium pullulans]THZ40748.1 hypothetical protein D6C87_06221 [Aureobasidium pullulans]THZ55963.1 hypothetical protein D6C86_08224 [Aureobasidium pullulans]THZ90863.1 hypothetical protein D6C88_03889 [Aureobasidium pullulans]